MRWLAPSQGDYRIRARFLWFPRYIVGEWRWWEQARWEEEYKVGREIACWVPVWWLDGKETDQ